VLSSFTQDEQDAIYYDKFYGMSSIRNLTIWVSASMSDQKAIDSLVSHYFSGTFRPTRAQIDLIISSDGATSIKILELNDKLLDAGIVSDPSQISN